MLAFLDFEASSLGKKSYPIEVAWVFEDGTSESHLITPAPEWTDWDPAARACLSGVEPAAVREALAREVVGEVSQRRNGRVVAHRALADAQAEREQWLEVKAEASRRARRLLF